MNVNEAIKLIKDEVKKVKEENKKYNNEAVKEHVKEVNKWLKDIIDMKETMLDLSCPNGIDYRTSIISSVNFCFDWIESCYFRMFLECGSIEDYEEYENKRKFYKEEQVRIRSLKI